MSNTLSDYDFVSHSAKAMSTITNAEKFGLGDYEYNFTKIDPREWIDHDRNESDQQKEKRQELQFENTLNRYQIYNFAEDDKFQEKLDNMKYFNKDNFDKLISNMTPYYSFEDFNELISLSAFGSILNNEGKKIIDRSQILRKYGLPLIVSNLSLEEQVQYRLKYPSAWGYVDIPEQWINYNDSLINKMDTVDLEQENFRQLGNLMFLNDSIGKTSMTPAMYDQEDRIVYDIYMTLLYEALPYPNPIILFRGVKNIKDVKVGKYFVQQGFSYKSYFYKTAADYSTTKNILVISYNAGHKFYAPNDQDQRARGEFVTYPGEILMIDRVVANGAGKLIFCHFVGYNYHVTPQGEMVIPQITDKSIDPSYEFQLQILRSDRNQVVNDPNNEGEFDGELPSEIVDLERAITVPQKSQVKTVPTYTNEEESEGEDLDDFLDDDDEEDFDSEEDEEEDEDDEDVENVPVINKTVSRPILSSGKRSGFTVVAKPISKPLGSISTRPVLRRP